MTLTTDQPAATTASVLCPLGCGRQVAAKGDEIHYCVTTIRFGRKKATTNREYVGTWDGEALFYGMCHDEVERQMRPYREEQLASELRYSARELDSDDPFNNGPSQEEQAASAARWIPCEDGWEQHTPHPFDPSQTVRLFQPRLYPEPAPTPPAWTAADQACLDALDGKGPWPTPDTQPAAKVNWSSRPAASCPIPCEDLRTLYTQDPAIYRLRLAALSASELEQQARVYAAYHSAVTRKYVTVEETLARFRRSVAIYRAQAAKPASDDSCAVLAELALTDPCALAEFLRAHTPVQRDMLAWRYAGWLSRRHGITVLPAYIAANWAALLGDTETDAGRAVDAQRCAESGG